ncbi:hypothetical protein [Blastococcus sp. SYSU DS0616]
MGKVLNSSEQAWHDALLLRLRMRDVPGARIGEVLAEVQSHVAETGEHPREAFGPAAEYADRVADVLGAAPSRGWRDTLRGLTWRDLGTVASIGLACFLLADSLWALGAGETSVLDLPAWAVCVVAALVLAACVARIVRTVRHDASGDKVVDPRTGAEMVPLPRWAGVVLFGLPFLMLAAMAVGGLLAR